MERFPGDQVETAEEQPTVEVGDIGVPEAADDGAAIDVDLAREDLEHAYADQPHTDGQVEAKATEHIVDNDIETAKLKLRVRGIRYSDLDRLAEIDLDRFEDTYDTARPTHDEVKEVLRRRLDNAGDLMIGLEIDGKVEGFMTSQRTNMEPGDFVSWEESTNNGTLDGTHIPNGKYIYIVNLTVMPAATYVNGTDMLITNMYGKLVENSLELGILSSRLPLFGRWVAREAAKRGIDIADMSPDNLDELAKEYVAKKRDLKGKKVTYDPQLHRYEQAGCKLVKVSRNAFHDPASLNYGAICIAPNPLPKALRHQPISWLAGKLLSAVSQRPRLLAKII